MKGVCMEFKSKTAQLFVPDGASPEEALERTTHMGVGAHQDDLEIMAIEGILQCFRQREKWFTGVTVTNGSGSPRDGIYKDYTDEEMRRVRADEQIKAAVIGEYSTQVQLDYPSSTVKDRDNDDPAADLVMLLEKARPEVVYTHNLVDKHDTHVGVALRLIEALRSLPPDGRPGRVLGCEIWRDLDWMLDSDKVVADCSAHENLQEALLGIFDSQVSGGKRYDLATMGRRRANATYYATHETDVATGMVLAMDLTPLVEDVSIDILTYVRGYIDRFAKDVIDRLTRLS